MTAIKPPTEKVEQAHGVACLRTLGAQVYVLGTSRRKGDYPGTMQTPGLPDVLAVLPSLTGPARPTRPACLLFWEVKSERGRLRPAQAEFAALIASAFAWSLTVDHVTGTFDVLLSWLVREGYVKGENVAAHRVVAGKEPVHVP